MDKVITIFDAKTNLSKFIKQAKEGHPVYIGSFGKQEVVLMAAKPKKSKITFGTANGQFKYLDSSLEGNDLDIQKLFYGE